MQLFENTVKLRGFVGDDVKTPSSDNLSEDSYVVLTICLESGVWWLPKNKWLPETGSYQIVCRGPYFCGFLRGMKQGSYVEVDAYLHIAAYEFLNHSKPIYEIRAIAVHRLELPSARIIEQYNR
jgi:hypothetical protein